MISELKKSEYYKCKGLLYELGHLEPKAVIEGANPGRVFVDNGHSPRSGLIWLGNNDGFFFIGDESNKDFNREINVFIDTVIKREALKVGLHWFEGIGNHSKWNTTLKSVFEHRKLGSWKQSVYTLQTGDDNINDELAVENEYRIVKIGEDLLENTNLSIINTEFVRSKILESWASSEKFFRHGIGYCMIYKHQIVSICFSGFVAGNVHGIDIETLEGHQGKKVAQKTALFFVKDCLDNGIVPYWDCMEMNKPSIAVAEKIGFKNIFNYLGFDFRLN